MAMTGDKRLLFICSHPNFKYSSFNLRFYSGNNDFLFQQEIYHPVQQVSVSGSELVCFFTNHEDIYVCNPFTQQVQHLPDGTGELQCLGFSYLSSSDEYIVVRLFQFQGNGSTGIEVLRFGKNANLGIFDYSWKKAKKSNHVSIDYGIRAIDVGPVVGRIMYWYVRNVQICILAFDIDDEGLYMIDVPFDLHQDYISFSVLMNLKGKLCVTGIDKTENVPVLKIWGLRDRGKSLWVAEYTIRFDDLEYGFLKEGNFNFEKMYPSCTSDGELVFGAYGSFYFYNIEKRSFRKVIGPEGCFKIGFI